MPGSQTIIYDGMGDMTTDSFGNTFNYDAQGRPVSINQAGTVKQITYDALGRAAYWTANGATTQILYDADGRKFAFMNGQSVVNYFVPLTAGVQAVYDQTGLKYYRHADWLGSSRLQLDTSGYQYGNRSYAPYGEPYFETTTSDRSFTGQTSDIVTDTSLNGTTELYDFLYRQYSPTQGRWLVPDPAGLAAVDITNPQTWNRYAYVGNNPLSNVDPLGLCDSGVSICVTTTIEVTDTLPSFDIGNDFFGGFPGGGGAGGFNRLQMIGDNKGGGGFLGNVSKFQLKQAPGSAPSKYCSSSKYTNARTFVTFNLPTAIQIAGTLQTVPSNVLGLAGFESGWGNGPLIQAGTNNYFSLTAGPAFASGAAGKFTLGKNAFWEYPGPGMLASGMALANSYIGARVQGANSPVSFATALNANNSYNSETLSVPYNTTLVNTINVASAILQCP